jgi:tetrapyrrole methylase family protein/MazG family protein
MRRPYGTSVKMTKLKQNPYAKQIGKKLEKLVDVMHTLRSEEGCPWDRAQSLGDLRQYVLEETYEVLQAMDQTNLPALKEELGDLMFQVVFLSQMMQEQNVFTLLDVLETVTQKMISRHPHVFGALQATSPEQALRNWESMKDQHKAQQKGSDRSILDGIPLHLPALQQALMISSKVVRVGFEWETEEDVWKKLEEEFREFREAETEEHRSEELGDILFTMVNIARKQKINPEDALRSANEKFRERFAKLEKRVYGQNKQLNDLTLAEMDAIWEEIKQEERKEGDKEIREIEG